MITICLDWNCIIALEQDRSSAAALHRIREWYKQGEIALCISSPSRLENHKSPDKRVYDQDEWHEKLCNVGLEDIELRPSKIRPFFDRKGGCHFFIDEEQFLMREVHARMFPNVDFMLADFTQRQNAKMPDNRSISSFQVHPEQESEERRKLSRKWNNRKNDALSIYAFGTWSGPDDVFVTDDDDDLLKKRDKLQAAYVISVPTLVKVAEDDTGDILEERMIVTTFNNVIQGHIMSPSGAVEYLQHQHGL